MADLVAVVCVVESSLLLASEWLTILTEYISPLLKRLGEEHVAAHTQMLRLAFISYGTSNTRPNPIIAKRFFTPLPIITKEIRDEHHKLGIGQTSNGGTKGMAALEGLVAAIEMFDVLSDSVKAKPLQSQLLNQAPYVPPRLVSHIIHIAASLPDGAPKPVCNDSPILDNVSWTSLPGELRKRNIHLSIINVKPNPPLAELHSAAAIKGNSPPWFKIRHSHTVLLTGFPTESKTVKRANENHASPDSKRPKIQPIAAITNSNAPTATTTAPAPAAIPAPISQPNPPLLPQSAVGAAQANPAAPNRLPPEAIVAKWRAMEFQLQKLEREQATAVAQGRMDAAAQAKKERDAVAAMMEKFKQVMISMRQGRPPNGTPGQLPQHTSQPPTAASGVQTFPSAPQIPVPGSVGPSSIPQGPTPLGQNALGRTGGPPLSQISNPISAPNPPAPGQMTPEMVNQMQKLVENRGIRPRQASLSQSTPKLQPPALPQPLAAAGSSQQDSNSIWEGALTWTGFDVTTHDRKEMQAQVKVISMGRADIMPGTWPTTLTLTPSRESTAPPPELQSWVKRTKAIMCGFQPHARSGDPQVNNQNFRSLVEMLTQKRIVGPIS